MHEAIVLALIPAIAYVMNFAYEAGFARNLGISPAFISLSFIDVLNNVIPISYSFAFSSIAFYLSLCLYNSGLKSIFLKITSILGIVILIIIVSSLIPFISNIKYDLFKAKNIKLISIFVFIIVALYLLIIKWGDVKFLIIDRNISFYVFGFLSILVMFILSYFQGLTNSKYQVDYAIFPRDSTAIKRVALRHYGEKMICSDIEQEKDGTYKNISNYLVIDISEKVKLIPEKIGPLKRKK